MLIEDDVKLDFSDVLIKPKRSTLGSRKDVTLEREYRMKHSKQKYKGVPIIAANMDCTGTIEMLNELQKHSMTAALNKHYINNDLWEVFSATTDNFPFYSMGILERDFEKFERAYDLMIIDAVCIDVANGYSERFAEFVNQIRLKYPKLTIMAGNVVTAEMTEQLILSGADIVKVGIGPGSVCTTRKQTGVGYPQLSAIIECADAAHGLGGHVCADGGCVVPGDVAKAFGAGADFVMLGGMLAGHDESGGEDVYKTENHDDNGDSIPSHKTYYGMSSKVAMDKHHGGVAEYRSSEGKQVTVPYRGPVKNTIQDILGGLRSCCTYTGARSLKDLSKRTTFIRVNNTHNTIFGD